MNNDNWEILREIVYRNWKKGDEVGLFEEVKSLIVSHDEELCLRLDKEMKDVTDRKDGFCKCGESYYECDCVGINAGLSKAKEIVMGDKK